MQMSVPLKHFNFTVFVMGSLLKALDTIGYKTQTIFGIKKYLVSSNGELLEVSIKHCEKRLPLK